MKNILLITTFLILSLSGINSINAWLPEYSNYQYEKDILDIEKKIIDIEVNTIEYLKYEI
jgi:hypothetical protein